MKKILSILACILIATTIYAGTTTNFGWNYGTQGQTPWWDVWTGIFQSIDTELYSVKTGMGVHNGLLMPVSTYINFGTTYGSTGYGLRDNAGTPQYKISGADWINIGTGGTPALDDVTDPDAAKTFTLVDNNASALSFGATGAADILKIGTLDAGPTVTIGGQLLLPAGSVDTPSLAPASNPHIGLHWSPTGNLHLFNTATGQAPFVIKGTLNKPDLIIIDPTSNIPLAALDSQGMIVSRGGMMITGDYSATYNPTTGIYTQASWGYETIPGPAMIGVVDDVAGPSIHICTANDESSTHFVGRERVPGLLPVPSVPNFRVDRKGNMDIFDSTTVGLESLNETDFTTHVKWDVTGDFNDTGGNARYTHSTGAGTLTQTAANLAVALKGNRWYKFVYTVSSVVGTPKATIPDTVAIIGLGGVPNYPKQLTISDGANKVLIFKTVASPTDFVINGTSTTIGHTFTLDDLSLKEIEDGNINLGGKLYVGSAQTTTGAGAGTLTNAPTAGDPTGYLKIVVDGAVKAIPYWDVP